MFEIARCRRFPRAVLLALGLAFVCFLAQAAEPPAGADPKAATPAAEPAAPEAATPKADAPATEAATPKSEAPASKEAKPAQPKASKAPKSKKKKKGMKAKKKKRQASLIGCGVCTTNNVQVTCKKSLQKFTCNNPATFCDTPCI